MKSRPRTIREYYVKCLLCGKEIRGTSEEQVLYNLRIHEQAPRGCKKLQGELHPDVESGDASQS